MSIWFGLENVDASQSFLCLDLMTSSEIKLFSMRIFGHLTAWMAYDLEGPLFKVS